LAEPEPTVEVVPQESEPVIIEVTPVEDKPEPQLAEEVVIAELEPTEEIVSEDTETIDETTTADIESVDETTKEEYPIIVKISHYNPNLGGPNCASFVNGECKSKMSNGERWQDYWGKNDTIACPFELPFGTEIELDGNVYTCRDRGGAIIVTDEGFYWIDILAESVPYRYGELREARIVHIP